jgi:hypothetical protein
VSRRSQVDQPLAEALARGETLAKAAEVAGCSLATAKRRWAEPEFRRRVIAVQEDGRRERQAIMHASWYLGVQLVPTALRVLQATLVDTQASHLDKSRAARLLIRAYGPKEEPPAPRVLSVEDEQLLERQAAQVAQLLQQVGNVVDLDTRRPPPASAGVGVEYAKTASPEPLGPPEPPPQEVVVATDPDDWEDPDEAPLPAAASVPPELLEPEEPPDSPHPEPERPKPDEIEAAWAWLRTHQRRPPPGPELVEWFRLRRLVGLDPVPSDRPGPRRRRRRAADERR